jgi:hypothetical protein
MKRTKSTELGKIIGFSALALTLAVTAFIGSNNLVFAAATQPETIPMTNNIKISQMSTNTASDEYQTPKLSVVWDDNDGAIDNQPRAGAMGYEKASQLGARYIWDMFGESIDGKAVEMMYAAWTSNSKTYWNGYVYNSTADISKSSPLYNFMIDAVTGEWISVFRNNTTTESGKRKEITATEYEKLKNTPPPQVDELSAIARNFAQKHFKNAKVASVNFEEVRLMVYRNSIPPRSADFNPDEAKIEIFEKGMTVTFKVVDDTGRTALVEVDMDSRRAFALDSTNSDSIPGFPLEGFRDGV